MIPTGQRRLRERVTVQEDRSEDGEIDEHWVDRQGGKLFAEVEEVGGGEIRRGRQLEANVRLVVTVRHKDWLAPMMRLKWRGQVLNIENVTDPTTRRSWLELDCSRVSDGG